MSVVDRVLAAVMPVENSRDRIHARARARSAAEPGDWLSMLLDHHVQIDGAFKAVAYTTDASTRVAATRELASLLIAHAVAEENVIYPALARIGERGHAELAYGEQSDAKLQLGLLEYLTPMSQEYLDKVEALRETVLHHVYDEESKWFLELKARLPVDEQELLGMRYQQEFERHMDEGVLVPGGPFPSVRPQFGGGALR
jgi:hypothetical protein